MEKKENAKFLPENNIEELFGDMKLECQKQEEIEKLVEQLGHIQICQSKLVNSKKKLELECQDITKEIMELLEPMPRSQKISLLKKSLIPIDDMLQHMKWDIFDFPEMDFNFEIVLNYSFVQMGVLIFEHGLLVKHPLLLQFVVLGINFIVLFKNKKENELLYHREKKILSKISELEKK